MNQDVVGNNSYALHYSRNTLKLVMQLHLVEWMNLNEWNGMRAVNKNKEYLEWLTTVKNDMIHLH